MSMMWIAIAIIAVTGIITDMISKNKKIELKRLEKEIELERLRLETYEIETQKMKLEIEQSKQQLIQTQQPVGGYLEKQSEL